MIPSIYGEDYSVHWRGLDFRGKVILDVGSDIGSTADYFLRNGAVQVFAVEGNPNYYNRLKYNASKQPGIIPVHLRVNSIRIWRELIEGLKPDLAKVDCEGCEDLLIRLENYYFSMVPEYMIETHSEELFSRMVTKLQTNGYTIRTYDYHPNYLLVPPKSYHIILGQRSDVQTR